MNSHRGAHELPGLKHVLVDGFRHRMDYIANPRERYYFLTHYHSDHYGGLNAAWRHGNIICSRITQDLIVRIMGVDKQWVTCVDIDSSISIPSADVTFLDANHCPGAVLLLFKMRDSKASNSSITAKANHEDGDGDGDGVDKGVSESKGKGNEGGYSKIYLHTGDMRYHPKMKNYAALQNIKIDKIFLDTTYAHPKHKFITQVESIALIVAHSKAFLEQNPQGLILLGAYNIGKERVICELQDTLGLTVYMEEGKLQLMSCLGEDVARRVTSGLFVTDPTQARVHVCRMGFAGTMHPYFKPSFENLENLRQQMNESTESDSGDLYETIKDQEASQSREELKAEESQSVIVEGEGLQVMDEENITSSSNESQHSEVVEGGPGAADELGSPASAVSAGQLLPLPLPLPLPLHVPKVSHILAFLPTGWAASSSFNERNSSMSRNGLTVRAIPYSEHSQCEELLEFVSFLRPKEIVPTVFSDEKNRLFVLDLFRNCVDRTANMRSFIASMGGPKAKPSAEAKTPDSASLADSEPITVSTRELPRAVAAPVSVAEHAQDQYSNKRIVTAEGCPKRKTPVSTSGKKKDLKSESDPVSIHETCGAKDIAVCSSAVIELCDAEEGVLALDHSDDIIVQRSKRKKVSVIGSVDDGDGRAVTLVTPEGATAAKERRVAVTASASQVTGSRWICAICTYCHRPDEWQYLQCALCSSNRPSLSLP